ncbi:hypothetical protein [Thalassobius sp. I31.1]|uniref:hypothetical protein n=1 Tax=Thalassobius sp. I31.1 TaxID=2109912 RepID=UPI000D1A13A9|nr:hypothetical protein [Thalassobius sp. I31.1]
MQNNVANIFEKIEQRLEVKRNHASWLRQAITLCVCISSLGLANQSLAQSVDISRPLSGEMHCSGGERKYGVVFAFAKIDGETVARRWLGILGERGPQKPRLQLQDTMYLVEEGSDSITLNPAFGIAGTTEISTLDSITLQVQDSQNEILGSEEGCTYKLSVFPSETAHLDALPDALPEASVANVGFSNKMALFADQFGAFLRYSRPERISCMYAITGGNGNYTRHALFARDFCNTSEFEMESATNLVIIGSDGRRSEIRFQQADRYIQTLQSAEAALSQQRSLEGSTLPTLLATAEGEYGAKLNTGFGYADYLVSVTSTGVRVNIDGVTLRCEQVVDPDTGDIYTTGHDRGNCGSGQFQAGRNPRDNSITYSITSQPAPINLPFLSGEMGDNWLDTVPEVATIKGISLGQRLPGSASEISGYDRLRDRGQLSRYSRSSLGIMGTTNRTNYFESATYLHASVPQELPNNLGSMSFDDLGIYGVNGHVVAMLRRFEPPEEQAPRFDSIQEALISSYGTPTISNRSGAGMVYEWHFSNQGTLLTEAQGTTCQSRFDSDRKDSRFIFLEHQQIETLSLAEIYAGNRPDIEDRHQSMKLRVSSECSYSIRYHIHPAEGGLLKFLVASMYAYDPVRTEIWEARRGELAADIAEDLELQKSSRSVAPDL